MTTPAELLAASPTQSISNAARILSLYKRNGEPNKRAVYDLIRVTRRLRLVDPDVPITRWTIASVELVRYIGASLEDGAA